jgi:hypothetical protein
MLALFAVSTLTLTIAKPGDGFKVPHTPILMPAGDLTVEAWVKPTRTPSSGPYQFIVSKNYGGTGYALLMIGRGERFRFQFEANEVISHEMHINVLDQTWWHVAGVLESGKYIKLYINGVAVAYRETKATITANDLPLYIGTSPWDTFMGQIDDVMIWKEMRTQEQIVADSKKPPSFKDPNLVAYWDFERVRSGKLYDRTHHTMPGEMIGKPKIVRARR